MTTTDRLDWRTVGINKASRWLGYSGRHIRRMCRERRLPNALQHAFAATWLIPVSDLQAIRATPKDPALMYLLDPEGTQP